MWKTYEREVMRALQSCAVDNKPQLPWPDDILRFHTVHKVEI